MSLYSAAKNKVMGWMKPKAMNAVDDRGWHVILESFAGAWQRNIEVNHDAVLAQTTIFACITLIASDIGKLRLRLVEKTPNNIWQESSSPAFSPVLRKPNKFQTRQQFIEQWVISKLSYGNAYILKERDNRGVVVAQYVLDPSLVKVLVADNGDVYYQLQQDDLSGLHEDQPAAPASEIIHDRMNCLFHPLVGLSPIFACGLAATKALKIEQNASKFFENMSRPSGLLTAPGQISDATAARLKEQWEKNYGGDNIGKVAVLGDGLKYDAMAQNAADSQLVEQLKLSAEQVCSTFHVPAYMVGAAPPPPYNNIEALSQQYYSQCLQSLIEAIESGLDEGLGLPYVTGKTLGTEFDLDDLLRMDSATQIDALNKAVGGGWMAPDEARLKRNLAPVEGGATPYLQQQNYSLAALAKRDAMSDPFGSPTPAPIEDQTEKALTLLFAKSPEALIHA
jgi:HK97 family phage portal protein